MAALGGALFAGIQLTEQERTQIQTIREKYQEELRPERPDERPNTDELRKARQSGDTAALRVAMEAQRAQRAEVMKAQMEKSQAVIARAQGELRAALLPEHREQFDANVAKLKERRENAPGATAPRGGAGGKAGRRGPPPPAQRGR